MREKLELERQRMKDESRRSMEEEPASKIDNKLSLQNTLPNPTSPSK
jgi:hypothetical protein